MHIEDIEEIISQNKKEENNLKEELEHKDKVIDLLVRELYKKAHICTRCYLQESVEECMKFKNCWECLRIHFENKAKENQRNMEVKKDENVL